MSESPIFRIGLPVPERQLFIPVVAEDAELCDRFIRSAMAGNAASFGEIVIEEWTLQLKVMADAPARDSSWAPRLSVADGVILLVQNLDRASLDALDERYRAIPTHDARPLILLFCRSEGVRDFKISCPMCRQKLWVRESEIGKTGRCAQCEARMKVRSPTDLLRWELRLPDRTPVLSVDPNDVELCRGAVANLVTRMGFGVRPDSGVTPAEFLKKTTVSIQLP